MKMSAVGGGGDSGEPLVGEDGKEITAPKESWIYLALIVFIGVSNYW